MTLSPQRDCRAVRLLHFKLWSIDGHAGAAIGVLAKIESADSVGNLEDILDAVDGAMVARGDLGAELPVEEVGCLSAPMYTRESKKRREVCNCVSLPCSILWCGGFSL